VDLCGLFDTGHLTQELAMWALKSCHLFNDLELSLTSTIAQQARLMVAAPGETLCEIGDVDCPLYIIVRGSFELSHSNEATGHKTVKKCTNSYPVNVKSECILILR
jgi:CRP-like cAMP-binding protein